MMPKGVEHTFIGSRMEKVADRENSYDAERR